MRNRKGFTLVELIVVLAILGVVSSAILVTLQFTNRSFVRANLQSEIQVEARNALYEIKKHVSVSRSVWLEADRPDAGSIPIEPDNGYCYIDDSGVLVFSYLSSQNGNVERITKTYMSGLAGRTDVSITFTPKSSEVGDTTDIITIVLEFDTYRLETDVFVQNRVFQYGAIYNNLNVISEEEGTFEPGIYIEFQ